MKMRRSRSVAAILALVAGGAILALSSEPLLAQEQGARSAPPRPTVQTEVLPGQACVEEQRTFKKSKAEKKKRKNKDDAGRKSAKEKKEDRKLVRKYGIDPNCEENTAKPLKKGGKIKDQGKNPKGSKEIKKTEAPARPEDASSTMLAADTKGSFLAISERLGLAMAGLQRGIGRIVGDMDFGDLLVSPAVAQAAPPAVLIVYDDRPRDAFGKLGFIYSILLRNLMGHFDATVDLVPIQNYAAGQTENYDAIFYMGAYYDNPIPAAFLTDVARTEKTVVWFRDNIWKLAWDPAYNFTAKFGLAFDGLAGLNNAPSPQDPEPGFFDTVRYKQKSFLKYYNYNSDTGFIFADPTVGLMRVTDPAKASVEVDVANSGTRDVAPYIVRAENFWYVADIPFSYMGPRDRYLVFADVLHDMLGIDHAATRNALVRLEDVGALTGEKEMKTLTDEMLKRNIPFSIALIPFYRDPSGVFNGGVPQEIKLADDEAAEVRDALTYATLRGGHVVMHGYTHQYEGVPNPYRAISGEDFEFWNIIDNQPVAQDSASWVLERLDAGLNDLTASGFTPYAWETPHYHASPTANRTFPQRFDTTYNRAVYYTDDDPDLDPANPTRDYWAGQFFPYVIEKDYYGQRILPENLGNIEYDISDIDPTSNVVYTWQDLLQNAEYATVIRDGYASFFFHPFWLEKDLGTPGFTDFKALVDGITNLGYRWVDPTGL